MREAKPDDKLFPALILGLSLLFPSGLRAQATGKPAAESDKATLFWDSAVDSRGPRWDLSEEPGLFRYSEQLIRERPNDRVVYVAYGPLGEVAWLLMSFKNWLVNSGGVREDLILTFNGGREKTLRYQAWLVPPGAELPKVVGPPPEDENAVIEFTDYPYGNACEYCGWKGERTLAALVEELRKRPRRRAYLEFFPCGRGRRRFAAARREVSEAKQLLIERGGVAPSRVLVKMKEAPRRRCEAQIWLLNSSPTRQQ